MRQAFRTTALGLCAAALSGGCAEKTITGPQAQEPVRSFSTAEQRISRANTSFGIELLRQLHAGEPSGNLLISPLSASMALGMTMNGAADATYDGMRSTLGFGDMPEAQVNAAYRGLLAQLHARSGRVEFHLANALWYEQTFPVKAPFLETVRTSFAADARPLDFRSPEAPGIISQWAEQQTNGRIRDLVESINDDDKMILVNAVYLKAPWRFPFSPDATRDGPFTRTDGSTTTVPLMSIDFQLSHFRDAAVQLVELPYADTAFAMLLLAPAEGTDLGPLIAQLTAERWADWRAQLRTDRVQLTVPKFGFEYEIEMTPALAALGMGLAFSRGGADFSRMSDIELYISQVLQKAFIDVDEYGTEAAAATAVTMTIRSLPPALRFDRPFIFAIHERESGALLFLGRVDDPAVR